MVIMKEYIDTPWRDGDQPPHFYDDEEEDMIEDEDTDNGLMDDDDLGDYTERTPDHYWFTECGGLTADAQTYIHELDSKGELV
mgnify:CR=1 FL=1